MNLVLILIFGLLGVVVVFVLEWFWFGVRFWCLVCLDYCGLFGFVVVCWIAFVCGLMLYAKCLDVFGFAGWAVAWIAVVASWWVLIVLLLLFSSVLYVFGCCVAGIIVFADTACVFVTLF